MAYQREPQDYDASPNPPASNGWWPINLAIGVLIAFAYWFFSVDWESRFKTTLKPTARAGAAHTDQRHIKEQPFPPGVSNSREQSGVTK
jgi:hypothetical protein